jgi:hypothetical protein
MASQKLIFPITLDFVLSYSVNSGDTIRASSSLCLQTPSTGQVFFTARPQRNGTQKPINAPAPIMISVSGLS